MSDRDRPSRIVDLIPSFVITRCLKFLVGEVIVYFALQLFGLHRLFHDDAERIGGLLQIIGTFTAFCTHLQPT